MLADHKFFQLMGGNPATIIVIASLYKNKKRQMSIEEREADEESLILAQIYADFYKENYKYATKIDNKLNDKKITDHMISQVAAAELSIEMLVKQNFKDDVYLVLLLGCLPGGATEDQIEEMTTFKSEANLERLN